MFSTQSSQSTLPLQTQLNSPLVGSLTTPDQAGTLTDPIASNSLLHSSDLTTQPTVTSDVGVTNNLITSNLLPIINLPIITLFSDNLMAGANAVGSLSSVQTFNNFVGASDTQDYYHFNLASGGNFNLSLTGLGADADVHLINSVGTIVASSAYGSNHDEAINIAGLAAGDYYVRVFQYSGDTNYTLRLSGSYYSELLPVETNIGALSGTQTFSGAINTQNTADTYSFSVADSLVWNGWIPTWQPTSINITLSGLSSDADIRLIHDANSNGVIDGSDVLAGSYRAGNVAEWISSTLSTGTYFVQIYQFNGDSNYHFSISTGDWYSQNLSDAGVIGEARYAARDGQISRNDMLAILRETKDYGSIDATEVTDLRRIVSDLGYLMPDYVRNLSNKVVNSDPANIRSGIGNLFAGSSSTQMENLIGKWFLGTDRPTAAGTYRYVSGSLFQGGISVSDIDQGGVGDCYFMSSLGAFANDRSSVISNMFIDNGDGTFTVRFYNGGSTEYVTVDRYLPTDAYGNAIYAGWGGGSYNEADNELWAALAERAYAQLNESGWIGQDNTNSYAGLDGGWMAPVMRQITGESASSMSVNSFFMSQSLLISLVNSNTPITAGFVSGGGYGVVNSHAYTITSYNAATGRFHLNNPWGHTHADVTWAELRALNAQIEWSSV